MMADAGPLRRAMPRSSHAASHREGGAGAAPDDEGGSDRGRAGPRRDGTEVVFLEALVAECPLAAVFLDPGLRILYASPAAERLLAQGDGLSRSGDTLRAPLDEGFELRLRQALAQDPGSARQEEAWLLSRPSRRRPFELWLRRPRDGHAGRRAGAQGGFLFVRDPDEGVALTVEAVRARLGLTKAEARTALAVLESNGIQEAARRVGLRPMTVRGYLRQAFEKTGAHSQSDLVRLLLSGATRFATPGGVAPAKRRAETQGD